MFKALKTNYTVNLVYILAISFDKLNNFYPHKTKKKLNKFKHFKWL